MSSMQIYYIRNKQNNKGYVGQTIKTAKRRWQFHCSNAKHNKNQCLLLERAIRKYGLESFEIEILEKCTSIKTLNEAEVKWIQEKNTLTPHGYNIESGGRNNKWTDDQKAKMRKIQNNRSPEWQANLKEGLKKRGSEWREHLSESRQGYKPTEAQLKGLEHGRVKGRKGMKGEKNGRSKLTPDDVREIRRSYSAKEMSQQKLADKFEVSQGLVGMIIRRKAWDHID